MKLLTTKEVSEILSVSVGTLKYWRYSNTGYLPYIQIGGAIRYKESDVEEFINRSRKGANHE